MAAKAPGRARRKGSNGRDGLASCMATTRRKRKPHGQRRVTQCERFNCSCGKQSRSDVIPLLSFHMQTNGGCADVTCPQAPPSAPALRRNSYPSRPPACPVAVTASAGRADGVTGSRADLRPGRISAIGPDRLTVRKKIDIRTVGLGALKTMTKSPLKLVAPATVKRTVTMPRRKPNSVYRTREHLTGASIG